MDTIDEEKKPYFAKVSYIEQGEHHRAYLKVIVSNTERSLSSPYLLGQVDSGADYSLLPYWVGKLLGFEEIKHGEEFTVIRGVGGDINCVERECYMQIDNPLTNEAYQFKETVMWKVPSSEIKEKQAKLISQIKEKFNQLGDSKTGTSLWENFKKELEDLNQQLSAINESLEGDTLIGMPFFDNFEYIKFVHEDRKKEDKCYFTYQVKEIKIVSKLSLT